jgi:hypothetical protein
MIYEGRNLVIKIVFESFSKLPVKGFLRPQAFLRESRRYSTTCSIDINDTIAPLHFGENVILDAVLEAPVGYGEKLKENLVLDLKDGKYTIGKAYIISIDGYLKNIEVKA